ILFLDPYVLDCFLDPSIERPTQSGNPNWNPSVRTRHVNPPGRVGENGTPIGSLFGILDPRIRQLNARPNPGIQIGIRQFAHVTLTHPVVWEKTARRSDPYLGFWTPWLCIRQLNARPNPGIQIGIRQFAHVTLTHPVVWVKTARRSDPYLGFWTPGL
ncbi:hypothetical protein Taro_055639, partial [Colocasia esculenta]|nr:hypothetical protein [Colocasia esculenta]